MRTAIVTGAARGIGKSIAIVLAKSGVLPVIADIDGDAAQKVQAEIEESGAAARSMKVDVSVVSELSHLVGTVVDEFGSIDILVNNAGILSTAQIGDLTEEEWDRTIDINLKSAVFASQQVIPYMMKSKWGRIINISSMAGRMGGLSTGCAYTASKAALIGVTMRLAREVAAHGITVNAVAPGPTKTEMVLEFAREDQEKLARAAPMGKLIEPERLAESVAFLASDAAEFITGAVLDVNGGTFMG